MVESKLSLKICLLSNTTREKSRLVLMRTEIKNPRKRKRRSGMNPMMRIIHMIILHKSLDKILHLRSKIGISKSLR
jgi:hypothetical protein